jgi:hypothetical protein
MVEWLGLEPCCSRFEFLITLITAATMMVPLVISAPRMTRGSQTPPACATL